MRKQLVLAAVTGLNRATDVSAVDNLSQAPASDVVGQKSVADLVTCPSLGAKAKETQTNPVSPGSA